MSNALYYTFSTIAQTLGGALALLAAFLLYRLQVLSTSIDRDAELIWRELRPYHGRADDLLYEHKYKELIASARTGYIPANTAKPEYQCARLTSSLETKAMILSRFRRSLYLTLAVISYSVLALVVTPLVAPSTLLSVAVFVIGLSGLSITLVSYIRVLTIAVEK